MILKTNSKLIAFDTGPGNALIDDWIVRHTGEPFDQNGAWAAKGHVHNNIVEEMLRNKYFSLPPPKAIDRSDFDLTLCEGLSIEDGAATLAAFSAAAVGRAQDHLPQQPEMVIVVGGGRRNTFFYAGACWICSWCCCAL